MSINFLSAESGILNDSIVDVLSRLVETDDIANTLANIFSISEVFFENFPSTAARSSITTS